MPKITCLVVGLLVLLGLLWAARVRPVLVGPHSIAIREHALRDSEPGLSPGLHWGGPMSSIFQVDSRPRVAAIAGVSGNPDFRGVDCITQDQVMVGVLVTFEYRLRREKAKEVFEWMSSSEDKSAFIHRLEQRLKTLVAEGLNHVIHAYPYDAIIADRVKVKRNVLAFLGSSYTWDEDPISYISTSGDEVDHVAKKPSRSNRTRLDGHGIEIVMMRLDFQVSEAFDETREEAASLYQQRAINQLKAIMRTEERKIEIQEAEHRIELARLNTSAETVADRLIDAWDGRLPSTQLGLQEVLESILGRE